MLFETFPVENGFEYIVSDDSPKYNVTDITVQPIDEKDVMNTQDFLNETPVTIFGKYATDGDWTMYYIHDDVSVICRATSFIRGFMEPNSKEFYVTITNDSPHGVLFDLDKVYVKGLKNEKDGRKEISLALYEPSSYEKLKVSEDYEAAARAVGEDGYAAYKLRQEAKRTHSQVARVGSLIIADMMDKQSRNKINEYLKEHKGERMAPMRTNSIKSGETYEGYIASKKKKGYKTAIYIPIAGSTYEYIWP